MNHYTHFSVQDREIISHYFSQKQSIRSIAKILQRSPSSVSREIKRNLSTKTGLYHSFSAQKKVERRLSIAQRQRKMRPGTWLWDEVIRLLHLRWSPDQIAQYLRKTYPSDMTKQISHEAIYQAIYVLPRGELRHELTTCLRRTHRLRRKRRLLRDDRRGQIPDMISIHDRPAEIESREVAGHWEGDLVVGKGRTSAIGTLVERTSRKVLICKLDGRSSQDVVTAFERRLKEVPLSLRSSLTYDRGSEMSQHKKLTKNINIKVFFCDPQSPWQRGSNENTNGLIRDFFPKGTNFNDVSEKECLHVERLLNERPRKKLGYRTPDEVFSDHLSVALES